MILKLITGFIYLTCVLSSNLPSVYVYDDPAVDWSFLVECYEDIYGVLPMLDERSEHAQNTGEVWMHRAALEYVNRVYDPKEADLFYLPLYISLSSDMNIRAGSLQCQGKSHSERIHEALEFIKNSEYYSIKAGSDHIVTCTWFWCGNALGNAGRVVLSRAIIGINESNNNWAMWECVNKIITVPYTASSVVTSTENNHIVTNTTSSFRTIPFYFAGSSRNQPDRKNLVMVYDFEPSSQIHIIDNSYKWAQTPEEFADTVMRSKFCFSPRGDTLSSRRLFDAVAAGCIPIITDIQITKGVVPFAQVLDYRKFCIVVNSDTFNNKHRLRGLVTGLMRMKEDRYTYLRSNMNDVRNYLVYGSVKNGQIHPGKGVFKSFMTLAWKNLRDEGNWYCDSVKVFEPHATRVTSEYFPPTGDDTEMWTSGTDMVVSRENKFLVCSPEFSNSEYIHEFMGEVIKASKWSPKWSTSSYGFDVLRVDDYDFYDIFMDLSWIKSIYTRDPVVRILDIYLSMYKSTADTMSSELDVHGFKEFVKSLYDGLIELKGVLKPISSHCGFKYSHYPTVIPSESIYIGKSFCMSLPEPMRSVGECFELFKKDETRELLLSCDWYGYYDSVTLSYVYELYEEDYAAFGYEKNWEELLEECF